MIGISFGVGFILGPAIASWLSHYSLAAPGWAAAGLSTVNLVAAWFILPEPESRKAAVHRPRFDALSEELGRPAIRRLLLTSLISITRLRGAGDHLRPLRQRRLRPRPAPRRLRLRLHRRHRGAGAGRAHRPAHQALRRAAAPGHRAGCCRGSPCWPCRWPARSAALLVVLAPMSVGQAPHQPVALGAPLPHGQEGRPGRDHGHRRVGLGAGPHRRPASRAPSATSTSRPPRPTWAAVLLMLLATAVAVTLRRAQPDDEAPAAPRGA